MRATKISNEIYKIITISDVFISQSELPEKNMSLYFFSSVAINTPYYGESRVNIFFNLSIMGGRLCVMFYFVLMCAMLLYSFPHTFCLHSSFPKHDLFCFIENFENIIVLKNFTRNHYLIFFLLLISLSFLIANIYKNFCICSLSFLSNILNLVRVINLQYNVICLI